MIIKDNRKLERLVCVFVKAVKSVVTIYILSLHIKQHNPIIGAGLELRKDRGCIHVRAL